METLGLTAFDIGVLVVVILSGVYGIVRGFTLEVLSLGAWVATVFATFYALPHTRPLAQRLISSEGLADAVAVVVTGIIFLIIFRLLARGVAKLVHVTGLGLLDRSLGVLFGLLRGSFVVCALYLAVSWIVPRAAMPDWVLEARTQPLVEYGASLLARVTPAEILAEFQDAHTRGMDMNTLDAVKERWPSGMSGTERPGYRDNEREALESLIERNI